MGWQSSSAEMFPWHLLKVRASLDLQGLSHVPGGEQAALCQRVENMALGQNLPGESLAPPFDSCVTLGTVPASLNLRVLCVGRALAQRLLPRLFGKVGLLRHKRARCPARGHEGRVGASRPQWAPLRLGHRVEIPPTPRFQMDEVFPGCLSAWVLLTQQSSPPRPSTPVSLSSWPGTGQRPENSFITGCPFPRRGRRLCSIELERPWF